MTWFRHARPSRPCGSRAGDHLGGAGRISALRAGIRRAMTDGESCPSVAGARLGSQKARGIHWHVNEVLPASATAGRTTPAVRVVRHRYHASRASLRPAFPGMHAQRPRRDERRGTWPSGGAMRQRPASASPSRRRSPGHGSRGLLCGGGAGAHELSRGDRHASRVPGWRDA